MNTDVEQRVVSVITKVFSVDVKTVTSKANFIDDLGADSLDLVELIMALEEEFDIEISDDKAGEILTVQQTIDHIEHMIH